MFFFFAGGVEQQVGRVLKESAGRCIRCGSTADLVEYEKVLKLFFVPVWRWPGKDPALYCRDCSFLFPQSASLNRPPSTAPLPPRVRGRCGACDGVVDPDFRFCPFCGSAL